MSPFIELSISRWRGLARSLVMCDQQPANNLLSIASAEWIQALQNFCHHGRVYDESVANAWLLDACPFVPSAALIRGVIEYILNSREDISYEGLRPSWVVQRLEQEGLISHRCGAVLHWQEHGYRFSAVVRVNPEQIWPDKRSRPEAFVTGPLDSQGLGVTEILAHPNARRRSPSPVHLAALVRSSLAIPVEPLHPIVNPSVLHAVLATYPGLASPEWFLMARSNDAWTHTQWHSCPIASSLRHASVGYQGYTTQKLDLSITL